MSGAKPRKSPCAACPYRRDAPSGLWAADEYDKLPLYDGATGEQAMRGAFAPFYCHHNTGELCAGWVGCHDMGECLAVRMQADRLDVDAVLDYVSPVPLFGSGAEAAEHGKREIDCPGPAVLRAAGRLLRQQQRRGYES